MRWMHPLEALTILGLNKIEDLSLEDVKKAYRVLAVKHHPDKGGNPEEFKKLVFAYKSVIHDFNSTKSFIGSSTIDWTEIFSGGSWKYTTYTSEK